MLEDTEPMNVFKIRKKRNNGEPPTKQPSKFSCPKNADCTLFSKKFLTFTENDHAFVKNKFQKLETSFSHCKARIF